MLELSDIVVRVGMAFLSGTLVGMDRESHGRAAGLRTTILVCVAAALSMTFGECLVGGAASRADLGRVATGILTGMGFLGAGSILREGSMVRGMTTAAMLWYVAVLGLLFGSGTFVPGLVGLGLGLFTLVILPHLENMVKNDWYVQVSITTALDGVPIPELRKQLESIGPKVKSVDLDYNITEKRRTVLFEARIRRAELFHMAEKTIAHFSQMPGVQSVKWI